MNTSKFLKALVLVIALFLMLPILAQTKPIEVDYFNFKMLLAPLITYAVTWLTRLIKKFPKFVTLAIVTGIATLTAYVMKLMGVVDSTLLTALLGLGSVFLDQLSKGLKSE